MPISDDSLAMALDIPDAGRLQVSWEDGVWLWSVFTVRGELIQSGSNLHVAKERSARQAMRVLLHFLILASEQTIDDFHDSTGAWVLTRRAQFKKALVQR